MAQRSVPAPFLSKTYQMVEDPITDDVISWNKTGTTFVVWKIAEFAKDLLPNYFKHNNFSSFVRQLNTYGFHKIVPDKWEFSNDNFKRGHRELLSQIRRRKAQAATAKSAGAGGLSPCNSGEDLGSTSTSSPDSKNHGSVETMALSAQFADLAGENKKLKKDNERLSSELAEAKKQCNELVAFLSEYLNVGHDQINDILNDESGPTCSSSSSSLYELLKKGGDADANVDESKDEEGKLGGESLKLFGVWLKGRYYNKEEEKKRCPDREGKFGVGGGGSCMKKKMKVVGGVEDDDDHHVEFQEPWTWMKISSVPGETSKVCN